MPTQTGAVACGRRDELPARLPALLCSAHRRGGCWHGDDLKRRKAVKWGSGSVTATAWPRQAFWSTERRSVLRLAAMPPWRRTLLLGRPCRRSHRTRSAILIVPACRRSTRTEELLCRIVAGPALTGSVKSRESFWPERQALQCPASTSLKQLGGLRMPRPSQCRDAQCCHGRVRTLIQLWSRVLEGESVSAALDVGFTPAEKCMHQSQVRNDEGTQTCSLSHWSYATLKGRVSANRRRAVPKQLFQRADSTKNLAISGSRHVVCCGNNLCMPTSSSQVGPRAAPTGQRFIRRFWHQARCCRRSLRRAPLRLNVRDLVRTSNPRRACGEEGRSVVRRLVDKRTKRPM